MSDAVPAKTTPTVAVGDKVWYVPSLIHQLDTDQRGERVFRYVFSGNSRNKKIFYRDGSLVENFGILGNRWTRIGDGEYKTIGGHVLKLVGPGKPWPALVREVFPDGTVALDVAHPQGGSITKGHSIFQTGSFITLHYPQHGSTGGLPYDAAGTKPHSWHLFTDKKGA